MADSRRKILPPHELSRVREELRAAGKRVVQCHGCFDIVHPGHIRYLEFARRQGDALIVSVSADRVVGKGIERPYINERLRAENLAMLEVVDHVCIDDHDWAGPILEQLRPDVYVKGKEYETKADPRFLKEKALVESYGGSVMFSSGDVVYSSTSIINAFKARFALDHERIRFYCDRHGLRLAGLERDLEAFSDLRVLVVGDPILDCYVACEGAGVAAESAILSVSAVAENWFLGGAGLIARQVRAFGGAATLLTTRGAGLDADRFAAMCEEAEVQLAGIPAEPRPTFVKTRYLVEEEKVFKVNRGAYSPLASSTADALELRLREEVSRHDAVLVTDFGYGMFSDPLINALVEACEAAGKPYFADVSEGGGANILKFPRPSLVAPNERELRFAFGDREAGLSNLAARYYRETGAGDLILTMGKRGAIHFQPPESDSSRLDADYLPSLAPVAVDPVGAGDVFLSTLSLARLAGLPTARGLYLASAAAAVHISEAGNDPVTLPELFHWLRGRDELR